jgi:hypothetical protein
MRTLKPILICCVLLLFNKLNANQATTTGVVIDIEGNKVYIDLKIPLVKAGDICNVVKDGGYLEHPITKEKIKRKEEVVCVLHIDEAFDTYSTATVEPQSAISAIAKGSKVVKVAEPTKVSSKSTSDNVSNANVISTKTNWGISNTVSLPGNATNVNFNRIGDGMALTLSKEDESEQIRQEWKKKGGGIDANSFSLSYTYMNMKSGNFDYTANGIGLNYTSNFINLKIPDYKQGMSSWSSFILGFSGSFSALMAEMNMEIMGDNQTSEITLYSGTGYLNLGYSIGWGRFLSKSNWKGLIVDLTYRPSYSYTKVGDADGQGAFNPMGFGIDFNFSDFNAKLDKIAPKAKTKFGIMVLPPSDDSPLFLSLSLGWVWYSK